MTDHRSGFVTFVGRPNVGKSTLTNALVGEKVAITSDKPQTTRRAIRGIVNRPAGQLVIVDTPGIHKPRTLLGQRLNDLVEQVLGDVDVICFLVPATEESGDGPGRAERIVEAACLDAATRIVRVPFSMADKAGVSPRRRQAWLSSARAAVDAFTDGPPDAATGPSAGSANDG